MSDKLAVIEALKAWANQNSLQEGDVTVSDLVKQLNISRATAREYIRRFAEQNSEEYVTIKMPDGRGHKVLVLRKR